MKKTYRKPNTKLVRISAEDIMQTLGIQISGVDTNDSHDAKRNTGIFDDLFDKVEGPADMTVEENDYSTHTTIE